MNTADQISLMNEGVLSVIGNTPLVRLEQISKELPGQLYAKLEMLNPGGSTKDRPAFYILREGIASGAVRQGTVVVESSSGNMGVGLAQACAYYGLRFICVVDPKTTQQNLSIMRAYGAEIDLVREPDPLTGDFLQARIDRVHYLLDGIENSFWPNQYANVYNPLAHTQTMREIVDALGGNVDYLFCATSTCGTIRGCAEFVRDNHLNTRIVAVDAIGSVIFGGARAKRLIPGHGAAVTPKLFQPGLADQAVLMSDLDCVVGCRRLVRSEAILAGGSSGAALMAALQVQPLIKRGSNCVVIFPDRGERYLDTIYSDEWVTEHFGEVSNLWEGPLESRLCVPMTC